MDSAQRYCGSYSAEVTMRLYVAGRSFAVNQAGPDRLILAAPAVLPACDGEFWLTIDGITQRWRAKLRPAADSAGEAGREFYVILEAIRDGSADAQGGQNG